MSGFIPLSVPNFGVREAELAGQAITFKVFFTKQDLKRADNVSPYDVERNFVFK